MDDYEIDNEYIEEGKEEGRKVIELNTYQKNKIKEEREDTLHPSNMGLRR